MTFSFVVCCWALLALSFTCVAIFSTRQLFERSRAAIRRVRVWPHIALVRPCEGLDPSLAETLRSSVTARYEGKRTIYFCVPSAVDPAYAVIERVRDELVAGGADVRIVVTAIVTHANRKAAQLAVVDAHLPPIDEAAILVIADSDVHLDEDSLPSLVSALLADRDAGAASAPPIDVSAATAGDRWSAALLSSTPHALLALAALSERSGGVPLLAGALLAVKRAALAAVGGFRSLEPYLGEDFELARRLHDAGMSMATSSAPARFTDSGARCAASCAATRAGHSWCVVSGRRCSGPTCCCSAARRSCCWRRRRWWWRASTAGTWRPCSRRCSWSRARRWR